MKQQLEALRQKVKFHPTNATVLDGADYSASGGYSRSVDVRAEVVSDEIEIKPEFLKQATSPTAEKETSDGDDVKKAKKDTSSKKMNLTEAYQLARQRGCKLRSQNSFRQWFSDNKGKILCGIKKSSDRGKYFDLTPD